MSILNSSPLTLVSSLLGSRGYALLDGQPVESIAALIKQFRPEFPPEQLVRIGGDGDGGYLVPSDINSYELLVSPGVGLTYEFDRYFLDRGVPAVLVDASVNLPPHPHMVFLKKYLSTCSSEPDRTISLYDILDKYGRGSSRIILQMDIEGAEYELLASTPLEVLSRFGVIVIEVHNLGGLCYRGMFPIINKAFQRLLSRHFVAHIHVNNSGRIIPFRGAEIPDTVEFTFLNRSFYNPIPSSRFSSPHSLDMPSIPEQPDVPVPRSWW